MWGSLLILPATVVMAVFVLYRLDNHRLRRSLQLALVISLATHLVILMLASATHVFNNPFQTEQPRVAQRPPKTITIRNQTTPFVWQKSHQKPTPEKEVEVEREQPETRVEQPQLTPVENTQHNPQPQVVRREQTSQSVPRRDQHMSELRRQTQNQKPRSSTTTATTPTEVSQKNPTQAKRASTSASKVEAQRSATQSSADRAVQLNSPQTENRQLSPAAERRTKPVVSAESAAENPTKAMARQQAPQLPKLSQAVAEAQPEAQPVKASSAQNRPKPAEITRRQTEPNTQTQKPEVAIQPLNTRSVTTSAKRRTSDVRQPTLSSPDSKLAQPRRSIVNSPVARTSVNIESPAPPTASATATRAPAAQAFAVTKSTAGQAGGGRSANLEKGVGSLTSPTQIASNATAERRTDSRANSAVSLSSQQKSFTGRRAANEVTPQSTVQATTQFNARLLGSRQPSSKTMSASATNVDSRSAAERSESSAEKGTSNLELGPTKVVMEEVAERRGGGGQPELSESKSQLSSPSGRTASNMTPTIMAEASGKPETASNPRSVPMSSDKDQPDATANAVARTRPDESSQRGSSTEEKESEATQNANVSLELTGSRASANSAASLVDLASDKDAESISGDRPSRQTQSPELAREVDFGQPNSNRGSSANGERQQGESRSAEVQQRSANSEASSSIARSYSSSFIQSTTALSEPGSGSSGRRQAEDATMGQDRNEGSSDQSRRSMTASKPSLSATPAMGKQPSADESTDSRSAVKPSTTMVARDQGDTVTEGPGAALNVDAPEGAAGLGDTPSVRLGIRSRPASSDSPNITTRTETRFKRPEFGGSPSLNPAAVLAKNAFRSRSPGAIANSPPSTEVAIQSGLEFLARNQRERGGWSLTGFDQDDPFSENQIDSDTAATGLAVLAFQGAGYNHREFKYADQLKRALQWMMDHQQPDGGLYVESDSQSNASARMYSHAIAALALTEAYGMTQDPELEQAAQKALDYISATQDQQRGGWRYSADPQLRSSDTSVTGWMMMALKSGRLAGLTVRPGTLEGIDSWLRVAVDSNTESQFRYNPYAVDGQGVSRVHGRKVSPSMTAVGLLMRVYSGWSREDERFLAGAESLLNQLPSDANTTLRDTYYWYYATQVLKHAGGTSWETWNQALHPLLVRTQVKSGELSGSWHPYRPVPDRWGAHGGRLYVTTLNLLSLEVRYRLLPLYENTVNQEEADTNKPR